MSSKNDETVDHGKAIRLTQVVIAAGVVLFALSFFKSLLLPVFLALLVASILSPFVQWMKRRLKVPEAIGAAVAVVLPAALILFLFYNLMVPAVQWWQRAPSLLNEIEEKFRSVRQAIEKAQETTEQIEEMTDLQNGGNAEENVVVTSSGLLRQLFTQARLALADLAIILILLYFLLARGRTTVERLKRVVKTSPERDWFNLLSHIQKEIGAYVGTYTVINTVLGFLTGAAMALHGLPNPVLWGVLAALFNFIPYLGPAIVLAILSVVSLVSFDTTIQVVMPPLTFFVLTTLEGQFITPMVLGRRLTLNPIFVFISMFFWGWVWGIAAIILAVPILTALKIISANVPALKVLHELIS